MNQLLTATELAAALGVNRSTIHRQITGGRLTPAGYAGRSPLFLPEDLERLKRGEQHFPQDTQR